MRISLELHCKYRINFAPHYMFTTTPKLLINMKSGKVVNQIMKGGSIGYVLDGKFYSLFKLKDQLEVIPEKENLPF